MELHPLTLSRFQTDAGTLFGLVPKVIYSRLIHVDEKNTMRQHVNSALIVLPDGRRGLMDAGCGEHDRYEGRERESRVFPEEWPAGREFARLGIRPEDIDFVLMTHLHWDHCGGLGRVDGSPAFPNATLYVHRMEWDAATGGNPLLYKSYPKDLIATVRAYGDRIVRVDGPWTEVLPGISLEHCGGHTFGSCVIHLEGDVRIHHPAADADPLTVAHAIYPADACPSAHHLRMVFQTSYDTHPLDTRAWKVRTLPKAAAEGWWILFDHDWETWGAQIAADERREYVVTKALPTLFKP